ncbi:hypothetical protein HHK36_016404 [Tetracentron sinense]|uniref:E3 ubiquitin-protein ligase n=1 Tax=Tetracentron sinense TaxID=13715 RepID=A0A835DE66_TETSI|nr:hypothetical protein HHK36_016404 [Tetracentron sinense]
MATACASLVPDLLGDLIGLDKAIVPADQLTTPYGYWSCADWLRFVSGMEVDSPPEPNLLSPRDRIVQPGLVTFVKDNKSQVPELVSAILPTDEEVLRAFLEAKAKSEGASSGPSIKDQCRESLLWLQWLMFEDEPLASLKNLGKMSEGQRGVCGAVWGNNDIAYRCQTCENDSTCAICVPCFQNGNHKDHDYSIMYTGGGCCDCGDVTAWKLEGFCSKHKGAEQIQPLREEIANSVGPVLDALFICWKDKLLFVETVFQGNPGVGDRVGEHGKFANELTLAVVEMLLEFCKYSESLLSFISRRVLSSVGLLDVLVRVEMFLTKQVVKRLHELLLKLLVPNLTPRLVKEMNLLGILLGCLGDIFISCAGEDGQLQVSKWGRLYETTVRVIEDIRYVVSHVEVPKYVTHDHPNMSRTWIRLLSFVHGMDPQKRETGLHVEEENENIYMPFVLGRSITNIHSLLVAGAFSVDVAEEIKDDPLFNTYKEDFADSDSLRHRKVGRLSQESSVCSTTGRSTTPDCVSKATEVNVDTCGHLSIPFSVKWLTFECLRAIEHLLGFDATSGVSLNALSPDTSSTFSTNFLALKRAVSKIRKGKNISKSIKVPSARSRLTTSSGLHGRHGSSLVHSGFCMSVDLNNGQGIVQGNNSMATDEIDPKHARTHGGSDDNILEADCVSEMEALRVLSLSDWPDIVYDVSSRDISVHIPLHRLLSLLLQKALQRCYGESAVPGMANASSSVPLSWHYHDFFGQILGGCHPYGFSAFVMEHPLRIRVFCAEVHAGMWRKNGDAAILNCEWYRSVRWYEQCLELDLFLLQCCAALAPPDLYVKRILERFGLSNYLSLNLEQSSEYEPVLVQEMLTLIIQIVKERRFCGLSTAESLQRELVYKLAFGDATHSQLVKSLPRDLSMNDQLQKILDTIAVYSNPSGMKQGKYSLRKTCWKELDLYHPRWNSRDLQVAEERYLRFCEVSALTVQLPRWTKIFHPLNGVARIATSKAVLQIVRAVLFYAVFAGELTASRAPDGVLTALHLLSIALDICFLQKQSSYQSCMSTKCYMEDSLPVLAFAGEEIDLGATNRSDASEGQSMLSLLVSLMRMHKKDLSNFIEAGNCNLSSLIESLLKKFAELDAGCMTKLQRLAPEVLCDLPQATPNSDDINISGSASDAEERKAKARERQAAILEKMRAAQSKFMASLNSTENNECSKSEKEVCISDVGHVSEESAPVCSLCRDPDSSSPVSFLILLQKSRLVSLVERGPPSWEQIFQSDKEHLSITANEVADPFGRNTVSCSSEMISSSHLAQFVQNAVNESAHDGVPSEVDTFLDFIKARLPADRSIQLPNTSRGTSMNVAYSLEMMEEYMYESIQRDLHGILLPSNITKDDQKFSTAEEGLTRSRDTESALLGNYIASLSREMSENSSASENALSSIEDTSSKSTIRFAAYDGFSPSDCNGIHLSSCGHAVHQECRDRYLSSLKERYIGRIVFEGGHIVDPDKGEFLCPVCRRLANSVLPALPGDSKKVRKPMMPLDLSSTFATGSSVTSNSEIRVLHLQQALLLLQSAANMVGKDGILKAFSFQRNERMRPNLEPVFRILCRMYFPDLHDKFSASGRVSHSMILWDTLKYSLVSTEISARGWRSCMRTGGPTSGLEALYKELETSTGFMLSLLLQIVQCTRSKSSLEVLLRFRGIQLFAESICSGVSMNEFSTGTGNISSVLKHVEKGLLYPDTQFWKRASDPVLARDPFSSLMWVLFCLPCPFLSSMEAFLSLVHLFYVICVTQAIITYCGKSQLDISELGFGDCLISDIRKIMGESRVAQKYFVSNQTDYSCHIKDIIRRLSFPYLRRCALLWKILNSSTTAPFCDRSHRLDASSSSQTNDDMLESTSGLLVLSEIEELENMFKIPPLDVVLKEEVTRGLVLKWYHHFCKEFEANCLGRPLHSTPAVPFKLMSLPHVYQDLLQRYIKQHCPNCKAEPALCLLCGRICSPKWKSCCRESGCQIHAMACGAGTGVFLLIRKTTILLQRAARQAHWPSPYLDAFGEEDFDMGRGKPLYLNDERYAALTHMLKILSPIDIERMTNGSPNAKIVNLSIFSSCCTDIRILGSGLNWRCRDCAEHSDTYELGFKWKMSLLASWSFYSNSPDCTVHFDPV